MFFKKNDALIGLIAVNVAVFVAYHIVRLFFALFAAMDAFPLDRWLAVPADVDALLSRPWTLVTYMFFHQGTLHLLFNMLWLYWFGKLFREWFTGWQLTNIYVLGGLSGAAFYVLSYNLFPMFATDKHSAILLGASGGVLAVVMAIACYVPRTTVNLLFLGHVRLIYIALFTVGLDVISISTSDNAGGHIAHLGGALFGFLFASGFDNGWDVTAWTDRMFERIGRLFKPKPKLKVAYRRPPTDDREYNRQRHADQQEIDRILDKISKGGYDSLTKKEKETLFHQKG